MPILDLQHVAEEQVGCQRGCKVSLGHQTLGGGAEGLLEVLGGQGSKKGGR